MELNDISQVAITRLQGTEIISVPAGKTIKIETSPQGVEVLNATVPAGKTWQVEFYVRIKEV